jgi:hypothetical protein
MRPSKYVLLFAGVALAVGPPPSGSGDQRQNAMLMILLARSCTVQCGFVRCSALNGPKSDPNFGPTARKEIVSTEI